MAQHVVAEIGRALQDVALCLRTDDFVNGLLSIAFPYLSHGSPNRAYLRLLHDWAFRQHVGAASAAHIPPVVAKGSRAKVSI